MRITSIVLVAALLTGTAAVAGADDSHLSSVTVSPQAGTLGYGAGGSVTYTVTLTRKSGASGAFSAVLSQTATLPSGAAVVSFVPSTMAFASGDLSKTSTLTISTAGTTRAGSTTLKVKAKESDNSVSGNGTLAIDRAPLTVTANDEAKIYNARTYSGAKGVTYSGFVLGETPAVLGGTLSYNTQGAVNVGSYAITPGGLTSSNYAITFVSGTLTIDPAIATVKANNKSKTYGNSNPSLDATVTGEVPDGTEINYTLATTATRFSSVAGGPYPITVTLGANPNYSVKVPADNGTLTVLARAATVRANNKSKTYGDLNPVLDATVTGEVSGGDAILYTLTTGATQFSGVMAGPYAITVALGANPNYNVAPTNGTLTIRAANATVTANSKSKTYGETNPALDATVTGQVTGGDAINYTLATPATQFSNVSGSPYAITVVLGANPNYSVTLVNSSLAINAAIATVTAHNKSKTYGAANPALDAAVTGQVTGGDGINYTLATTAAQFSNVADGPFPIAVTLGANPNYSITPANGTLTIGPAIATVRANNKSKTYGDLNPGLDATVTGAVSGGDAINYSLATTVTQFSGVGGSPYAIVVTLGANPNYAVTLTNGALAINSAIATVRANNKSKTYGQTNPALDATVMGQVTGGDPINFTLATAVTQFTNVVGGPYAITVTLGANPNYSVTPTNGTLSIGTAPAAVSADNKSKVYGDPVPALGATVTGAVTGGAAIVYTLTTTATQFSNVATSPYPITVSLGANPNYSIVTTNGTLTVQLKTATVRANDKSKAYGLANPALDATVGGQVTGGDPVNFTLATTAGQFSNVGGSPYAITVSLGANPNYSVLTANGTLTISAAGATVTANNKSKTYGATNPTLDAAVTGQVTGGDAINYTLTTTAAQYSNVADGPYPITVTLGANPNYKVAPANGTLTIQRAIATVTANSKAKTYGDPNPALDATVAGEVTEAEAINRSSLASAGMATGGDPIHYTLATTATQFSNVATSPHGITVTLGANPNYNVTPTNGTLTINPAVATVKANSKAKTYGDLNPTLDATVTGQVTGGDPIVYSLSTAATQFSNVAGSPYAIAVTLGANPNYSVKVPPDNGTLSIQRAIAMVTANDKSKNYGAAIPTLDATVIGQVPGGDAINYTLATTAVPLSNVATSPYPITVTLGANPNYSVTLANGALRVDPAIAIVKANNKSKFYGAAIPTLDATVTGEVPGGDRVNYTLSTAATPLSNVANSPFAIAVTLGSNPNYSVKVPADNGTLTIQRAIATVTANDKSRPYGSANPTILDATVTGEVPGGDRINYTLATTATPPSNVAGSPYPIIVNLGTNPNYDVTPINGGLTVLPAFATVKANSKSRAYGSANPTLDATVTGEVPGGDRVNYTLSTAATPLSNVLGGPYGISVTLGANPNYSVKVPADNGTLTVQPAPATVTANDKSKIYGAAIPTLDATVTGAVTGGDPVLYTLATAATPLSGVLGGPYAITVTPGLNPNYTVTVASGALTVQPAFATVKANGKSKLYGAPIPTLDATVTGEVPGGDRINYTLSTPATPLSNVLDSPFGISVTLGFNPNYSVKVPADNGTLTVQPKPATVNADDKSKIYGAENPTFDATVTGEVPGGDLINYTLATAATRLSGVLGGPYPITVVLGSNPNYSVTPTSGELRVDPAFAIVKANSKTKLYGAAVPPLDATVTGEVPGGDRVNYSLSTPATPLSRVLDSPFGISVTLGFNPNYSVKVPADNGTLTVQPAPATVTANDKSKIYGAAIPTLDATVTGEVTGGDPVLYTLATTATPLSGVLNGPYAITVTLGANPNYTVTPTSGALTVNPAFATVKANSKSRAYGAANPTLDATVTGEVPGGDRINYTLSTPATPLSNVSGSPYGISVTLGFNPNYSVKVPADNGTLRIDPAVATVTANNKSKFYGAAVPALDANVTGEVTGGDRILYNLATTATPLSGVLGGPYPITVVLGLNPNYSVTPANGALRVDAAIATVKANSKNKFYGAPNPTPDATVTGEVPGGDPINYTLTHTATQFSNVAGSPFAITVTLGSNPNYSVKVPADNGTLRINPAVATVTANDKSKIYGAAIPTLDATVVGEVQGGDPIHYTLATTATPLSNVAGGPYAITVTLGLNPNYNVSQTNGALRVDPAFATMRIGNMTKFYGDPNPTPDVTITGQVPGGDPISYTLATTVGNCTPVGTYPFPLITLGVNPNYSIQIPAGNGTLTILPRPVTVKATDKTKVYGSTNPTLDATVTNAAVGCDLVLYTLGTAATQFSNVLGGPYPITITLGLNPNYSITPTNGLLTVQRAPVTLTISNRTKIYGDPNPLLEAETAGEVVGGDAVKHSLAALGAAGGGDPINYTLTTTATQCSPLSGNPYPITAVLGTNPNYDITLTNGTLTIQPRPVTVRANNKTRTYGDPNPALDATVTNAAVGCDPVNFTLGTAATQFSGVASGPYAIEVTLGANPNYSVTPTNGTLAVQIRPVTVTADARTKVYGDTDPALTYTVTSGSLVGTDVFSGELLRVSGQLVAASPFAINQGTLALSDNYALTYVGANLAITPATLTVTANHQSKVYGNDDPTLSYVATGFKFSDDAANVLTGGLTRAAGQNVAGSPYAIQKGNLASNTNYTIGFTGNDLEITTRPVTVAANTRSKIFGGFNAPLTYTITSGSLAFNDAFTGALERASGESVTGGPYAILQGTLALNSNYALTYVGATLSISPAPATPTLTVTPNIQQYSDFVLFTATIANGYVGGQQAMDAVTVKVGTIVLGTIPLAPNGSDLTGTLSVALLEPTLHGLRPRAPGAYTVTAADPLANPNFAIAPLDPASLTILPEDARAAYTGALLASTSGGDDNSSSATIASSSSSRNNSGKATVTLSATIRDITATSDAAGDVSFGDIRNATVTFVDRDHGNAVIATVPVDLVTSGQTMTATATYDWAVNIGSASSKQLRVGIIVDGYYTRNSPDDNAVVTVSKPASSTVAGNGCLTLSSSSGILAGGAGTQNDFSFNLKYKNNGTLQGSFSTVVRSGGRVYQVDGANVTSLAVQVLNAGGTATLNGKASIRDITNPSAATTVDNNATLQVTMADFGLSGTPDAIAITVWNKKGGLWFASNWDGARTVQQALACGDVSVSGGKGGNGAKPTSAGQPTAASAEFAGGAVPLAYAFPQNFPNPFSASTTLRFELPEPSRVTLTIYDVTGREVANLVDGTVDPGYHVATWSGRNRDGYPAGAGVYFARIVATPLRGSGGLRSDRRVILVR
jgi:hypothetical protein